MVNKIREIIINLDPNAVMKPENFIPDLKDELISMVEKRLIDFPGSTGINCEEEYHRYKRHDSILIDGTRGSGKSTTISFLYSDDELQKQTALLEVIDPNQLDPETNILNVIIDNIFEEVENHYKVNGYEGRNSTYNEALFQQICKLKTKIDNLTFNIKLKIDRTLQKTTQMTKEERVLDKTIHEYAYNICHFLNKRALVQPIDDIDMNLKLGQHLLEILRKYMQSPRIIPIVALDSGQIYALIKQEYFKPFGYDAKTPLREIDRESEMTFLKKLPSEYIQKILPPSQRVIVPDMYDFYRSHLNHQNGNCGKNHDYNIVKFKGYVEGFGEIILDFEDLLLLIMSILYGFFDKEEIKNPLDYHVGNYLKNKTFRSFMDDARAVIKGLRKKEDRIVLHNASIKERFRLYSKSYANDHYDAAEWFWESYIQTLYKNIDDARKKESQVPTDTVVPNYIEEILMVKPNDASNLGRKEKTYYRIFLQEFFLRETIVNFKDDKNNIESIEKVINLQGYIEFILRTLLPASIFELLCEHGYIDIINFPFDTLKEFAEDNGINMLHEVYNDKIVFWPLDSNFNYIDESESAIEKEFILSMKLENSKTRPFRKWLLEFSQYERELSDIGFIDTIHPFKMLCFATESIDINSNEERKDRIVGKYIPRGYIDAEAGQLKYYKEKILSSYDLILRNQTFGIMHSILYTRYFAKTLVSNLLTIHDRQKIFFNKLSFVSETSRNILFKIEARKYLSTIYASFLNMLIQIAIDSAYPKYKYEIRIDRIVGGIKNENILLPFITDDPFVRNLNILMEISIKERDKDLEKFIKALRELFQLFRLDENYYFGKNNRLQKKFSFGKASESLWISSFIKEKNRKNAYFELFYNFLIKKAHKELLTIIEELSELVPHPTPKYQGFSKKRFEVYLFRTRRTRRTRQNRHENPNDKSVQLPDKIIELLFKYKKNATTNLEKNIYILLIDAFVFYPPFFEKFASYIKEKETANGTQA